MEREQDGLVGVPSECLLLKNMFDPSTETEPDFDEDIRDDVLGESSKFGQLKHMYVDKNSAGFVYLRINNVQAAMDVQHSLHGRLFGGKMITATYMTTEAYEAKFPEIKIFKLSDFYNKSLLLQNMFDPSTETDPEFHWDAIEEQRRGFRLLEICKRASSHSCTRCSPWKMCGGKMLTATYMTPEAYAAKFPRE